MAGFTTKRSCQRAALVLASSLLALTACDPTPQENPRVVRSLLEQRRDDVVIQQWDVSCGAAALATLVTYDLGVPLSEREAAIGMLHFTTVARVRAQLGFSLLDLKRFAESRGFSADGYGNMTLHDLAEAGPAIVPVVLRGFNHFVVFRGIQGDRVLLADPAWGNRTMQIPYFLKIWQTRVAFAVSRKGTKPAHRLEANASDFPASSTVFETPARKTMIAKLMDQPPSKAQTMVASAEPPNPLAQSAAGPAGGKVLGSMADLDQPTTEQRVQKKTGREKPADGRSKDAKIAPVATTASFARKKPTVESASIVAHPGHEENAIDAVLSKPDAPSFERAPDSQSRPGTDARHHPSGNSAASLAALVSQADVLLAHGEIATARLFYVRAAEEGSAHAATALGKTYDPLELQRMGVVGVKPYPGVASLWYRKAIMLGDSSAAQLLQALFPTG